ncbi:FecR family protein [Aquimarina amphilecti]|uniref:FecR family protein n=1 Tax=Aquimarina amphilecti TaxID=1038014 RepID=A0A1H7HDL7_AQUAM|nr:FecR family protein [Aquimarina amphilecti]SEK48506.1 FecR family protein [Aquimarina amphilecti]
MENKFTKNNLIARWLDNRLDKDEKEKLDASGELDELKVVLDDIDTWKVKKFDTNAGLEDLNKRKKFIISPTPKKERNISKWLSIAASVAILITGGYFSWNYFSNQTTTINTLIAETKTIELPGGSQITMDALSTISYNEKDWLNDRTIYLTGQAFFDVTKGNSFSVITESGSINVLGTQFNVNSTNNKFEVKCYEGKVNVTYNTDEKILTKGESVSAKENRLFSTSHTTITPEWINGYSKYNQVVLSEIVIDLEKYYTTKIMLPKKYKNLQFTGTLTHKNLKTALQTLFSSMEIEYSIDSNNVVIIK